MITEDRGDGSSMTGIQLQLPSQASSHLHSIDLHLTWSKRVPANGLVDVLSAPGSLAAPLRNLLDDGLSKFVQQHLLDRYGSLFNSIYSGVGKISGSDTVLLLDILKDTGRLFSFTRLYTASSKPLDLSFVDEPLPRHYRKHGAGQAQGEPRGHFASAKGSRRSCISYLSTQASDPYKRSNGGSERGRGH
ncbi:hypothetical protein BDZ90DRAFT_231307 [Jaminaea rosea]|uniref:Uncharacterized protein n=1 Tax=Jaminaea rosea TaxID=1569628 RepID=A0A316USR6_9BASI|nr:hypothetical protein BDZ90DRAFT_231307 [Jaminaea rosea]PWN28320.1 hypothetical protein BDZ90DRAFT_231307 [Jaminaea rosea]